MAPKKHLTDLMEECEQTLSSGGFLLEIDKNTSLVETEMRRCSTLPKCYQAYTSQNAFVDKQQRDDALALREEDKPQGLSHHNCPMFLGLQACFPWTGHATFQRKKTTHAQPLPICAAALLRHVLQSNLLLRSRVCQHFLSFSTVSWDCVFSCCLFLFCFVICFLFGFVFLIKLHIMLLSFQLLRKQLLSKLVSQQWKKPKPMQFRFGAQTSPVRDAFSGEARIFHLCKLRKFSFTAQNMKFL